MTPRYRVILFNSLLVMLAMYLVWPAFSPPFHWTTDTPTYNRLESRVVLAEFSCGRSWCGTDLRFADSNLLLYCPKSLSGCRHLDKNLQPGEAVNVLYHCQRQFISLLLPFGARCSVAELDTANGFPLVTLANAVADHTRTVRLMRYFAFGTLFLLFLITYPSLKRAYTALRSYGNDQSEGSPS